MINTMLSIDDMVKVYTIGYMLEDVRVRYLQDVKLNMFDINIDAKKDDTSIIPRWLAEILSKDKLVEINEQDMSIELTRALSRERVSDNEQLAKLRKDLYIRLKPYISKDERLAIYLHDLIDARLWKILNLARISNLTPELEEKLTIEERILFQSIYKAIDEFKGKVLKG